MAGNNGTATKVVIAPEVAKFTTNLDSIATIKDLKARFTFDDATKKGNLFILLSGVPKVGKTHFACTMSEITPTYLLDTEYKGGTVVRKFDSTKLKYKIIRNYLEMVAAVKYITSACPKGCIIIDSGTDLQTFAEEDYLFENKKTDVGMPWNWADVWSKCNAVIKDIKASGFDLILTTRMKEEFKNNVSTGVAVPRIYSNAPYLADLAIEWDEQKKPWLKLNALERTSAPVLMDATTLPELLALLKKK
jgi:hypothetical protein